MEKLIQQVFTKDSIIELIALNKAAQQLYESAAEKAKSKSLRYAFIEKSIKRLQFCEDLKGLVSASIRYRLLFLLGNLKRFESISHFESMLELGVDNGLKHGATELDSETQNMYRQILSRTKLKENISIVLREHLAEIDNELLAGYMTFDLYI